MTAVVTILQSQDQLPVGFITILQGLKYPVHINLFYRICPTVPPFLRFIILCMSLGNKIPKGLFFAQLLCNCFRGNLRTACSYRPVIRLHRILRAWAQPAAFQIIKHLRLCSLPYACCSSHTAGCRIIIGVRHSAFVCQNHLSVGFLYRRSGAVCLCDVVIDLIGSAVIHMGSIPGVSCSEHMSVGIGSGADCLRFQGF